VAAFAKNKKLSPSEIIYITKLQEGIEQKETEKGILLQTRETATAYRHQQIKTYKYQLDTE
jgi:glycine cleavage system regulatory protein